MATHRPPKTSKELANAAYDDFKRKAIDEAKKRAVSQRVDYDMFKNMVLTAHLKPFNVPTAKQEDHVLPWTFSVDGTLLREQIMEQRLPTTTPTEAPSTSGDFYRDWRRSCPSHDDKYRFLKLCGPDVLRAVFKVEVSAEVLRELLAVLNACWLGHAGATEEAEGGGGAALREAGFVVQVLNTLTGAGRFSLTVKLLGGSSKPVLAELFASLEAAAAAAEAAADAGEQGAGESVASGLCSLEQLAAVKALYGLKAGG